MLPCYPYTTVQHKNCTPGLLTKYIYCLDRWGYYILETCAEFDSVQCSRYVFVCNNHDGQRKDNRGCVVLETERDKKNINMTRAYPKNTDIYIYNTSWRAPTSPCSREPYRSLALTPRTHGTCKERWLAWMTHKHKLLLSSSAAPALTCLLVGGRGWVWLRCWWIRRIELKRVLYSQTWSIRERPC